MGTIKKKCLDVVIQLLVHLEIVKQFDEKPFNIIYKITNKYIYYFLFTWVLMK